MIYSGYCNPTALKNFQNDNFNSLKIYTSLNPNDTKLISVSMSGNEVEITNSGDNFIEVSKKIIPLNS